MKMRSHFHIVHTLPLALSTLAFFGCPGSENGTSSSSTPTSGGENTSGEGFGGGVTSLVATSGSNTTTTSAPTTTTGGVKEEASCDGTVDCCGNGTKESNEDCDPGAPDEYLPLPCKQNCTKGRVIFVSSQLVGLNKSKDDLDTKCADFAAAADLPGTFIAIVNTDNPPSFPHRDYYRPLAGKVNFELVFSGEVNFDDLTTLELKHPLDRNEYGVKIGENDTAWTGYTRYPEKMPKGILNCNSWTKEGQVGTVGIPSSMDFWLDATKNDDLQNAALVCSSTSHIYCIQTAWP